MICTYVAMQCQILLIFLLFREIEQSADMFITERSRSDETRRKDVSTTRAHHPPPSRSDSYNYWTRLSLLIQTGKQLWPTLDLKLWLVLDNAVRLGQELWSTWATAAVKDPGVVLWVVELGPILSAVQCGALCSILIQWMTGSLIAAVKDLGMGDQS